MATIYGLLLLFCTICQKAAGEMLVEFQPKQQSILLTGSVTYVHVICRDLDQELCVSIAPIDESVATVLTTEICALWTTTDNVSHVTPGQILARAAEPELPVQDPEEEKEEDFSKTSSDLVMVIQVKGSGIGRTYLNLDLLYGNRTVRVANWRTYAVAVVKHVSVVGDVFMYVLSATQMLTLLMLGCRLRRAAIREVLTKPCGLMAGVLCQIMLMPLVKYRLALIIFKL